MNDLLKSKRYQLGLRLRRLWYNIKYFLNGETRRDKRERKAWANLAKKARANMIADDERDERRITGLESQMRFAMNHGYLQEDRPYKDCMKPEHFQVIMRNRVVELKVGDQTIYEVNTKGMEEWEVEEFWHMLKDKSKLYRPRPIIRAVMSDRFPQ